MLVDLFEFIKKNGSTIVSSSKGSDFEDQIAIKLRKFGFERMLKDNDDNVAEYLSEIRNTIQAKTGNTIIKNELINKGDEYGSFFVSQPYGSQDFPDFLVFTKKYVYSIECKFVEKDSKKPVWNGNVPKSQAIYIFGSYAKRETIFFLGEDVLPEEERINLLKVWDDIGKDFDNWMKQNKEDIENKKIKGEYGFVPYVRKAYDQSRKNNPSAQLDYFGNKNKAVLIDNVIDFVKKMEG